MVNGITFNEQLNTSADFAHFQNVFLNGSNGVTKGCGISQANGNVYIQKGYFVVCGRFVRVTGVEEIASPDVASGQLYCTVVFEVNLANINTEEEFTQGYFRTLTNVSAYPSLEQQDLDDGGTLYQMPWCQYIKQPSGISNFRDLRNIIDMQTIWKAVSDQNGEYKGEFDGYFANQKAVILQMIQDLESQSYVKLSDARAVTKVTLKATDWTGASAPYSQTVMEASITADMEPILVRALADGATEAAQEAYGRAFAIIALGTGETEAGKATFKVYKKPTTDCTVGLKGV